MDQQSRLGGVRQKKREQDAEISATNRTLIIVLCLVVVGAAAIAVAASLLLSWPLVKLAEGMYQLAFMDLRPANEQQERQSLLAEVSQCQRSFGALER